MRSASSASMPCKLIACSSFVCLAPCCSLEKRSKLHFNHVAQPRSMELHSSLLRLQGTFLLLDLWGPLLASRDSPEANAAFPSFSVEKSWKSHHPYPLSPILTRTAEISTFFAGLIGGSCLRPDVGCCSRILWNHPVLSCGTDQRSLGLSSREVWKSPHKHSPHGNCSPAR